MSKNLTILDIAKLSGVGKSTVSRVLTNDPKVKLATRLKVEQVIQASGYVPSKSAQSMRGGRQKVIGVILSRLDSPSENKAVSTMLGELYRAGYDVVIMESQLSRSKTNEHLEVLRKRNVDGVIVFGFTGCDVANLVQWHEKAVVIAMEPENLSSVNYDNTAVIRLAIEHLVKANLKEIAYIGVDPSDRSTGELRLNAYLDWCKEADVIPNYQTGQLHHESAYALVNHVITNSTQAIVCASDTLALGVIKRLQELKRDDILVTGVGGNDLLSFLFPNTYSVDPGYAQSGAKAAKLLISQLSGAQRITHITQTPILI